MQPFQEQVGEQERCEMVQGQGVLGPVRCRVAGVPVPSGVVDQDIDEGERGESEEEIMGAALELLHEGV